MVVGFTTICAISAYHHKNCEFKSRLWWGVLDTTLCAKVCQWLVVACQWLSPNTPVSTNNKTDCHDITEILLKVAFNPNLSFLESYWGKGGVITVIKWSLDYIYLCNLDCIGGVMVRMLASSVVDHGLESL